MPDTSFNIAAAPPPSPSTPPSPLPTICCCICRQTVLNRLVGQHLALAAFHAGGLPPAALATDCELR